MPIQCTDYKHSYFKKYVIYNYFGWSTEVIFTGRKWNQLSAMFPTRGVSKIVSSPDRSLSYLDGWFHLLRF